MGRRDEMPSKGSALSERAAPALTANGFAGELVAEIQRARMLIAMTEVVAERGLAKTTVAHVVARSGVSRRTFYEMFADREGCFLTAFDDGVERVKRRVLETHDPKARWDLRVRTALIAVLSFLDIERAVGKLLVVDSLGGCLLAFERRRQVLAGIIAAVDEGRSVAGAVAVVPSLAAEAVVGAVLSVVHTRMLDEPPVRLLDLTNELMGIVVLPFAGPAAARRELARPLPEPDARLLKASHNPLGELDMRLTYRTVRVLMAVAAAPAGSNRQVADAAGINDQGQISKLLARLERLGLIHNGRGRAVRGAPNAWALTKRGMDVHGAIGAHGTTGSASLVQV
jgi:AcrR family transcriptional regulator